MIHNILRPFMGIIFRFRVGEEAAAHMRHAAPGPRNRKCGAKEWWGEKKAGVGGECRTRGPAVASRPCHFLQYSVVNSSAVSGRCGSAPAPAFAKTLEGILKKAGGKAAE